MNRQETKDKVIAFLKNYMDVEPDEICEDNQLMGELGFNSLKLLLMANEAEDEFGVMIDDEAMETFVTVGDVIDFMAEHQA